MNILQVAFVGAIIRYFINHPRVFIALMLLGLTQQVLGCTS